MKQAKPANAVPRELLNGRIASTVPTTTGPTWSPKGDTLPIDHDNLLVNWERYVRWSGDENERDAFDHLVNVHEIATEADLPSYVNISYTPTDVVMHMKHHGDCEHEDIYLAE